MRDWNMLKRIEALHNWRPHGKSDQSRKLICADCLVTVRFVREGVSPDGTTDVSIMISENADKPCSRRSGDA